MNKLAPDYLGNLTLETINTSEATAAIDGYVASLERKARATALQNKLVEIETGLIDANNKSAEEQQGLLAQGNALLGNKFLAENLANNEKQIAINKLEAEKQAILGLLEAENQYTDEYVGNAAERTDAEKAAADEAARLVKVKGEADKAAEAASAARRTQREKDKAADEKAAADAIALAEKVAADEIALEIEKNKLLEDLEAKAIQDKNIRALAELEIAQERERAQLIEKFGKDTELMKALEIEQRLAMDEFIAEIEEAEKEKKIEIDLAIADAKQVIKDKDLQDIEDVKQAKIAAAQEGLAIASQVGQALTDINNAVRDNAIAAHDAEYNNAKKNGNLTAQQEYEWAVKKDKILKAAFEREKKVNIAMGIISTAQSVLSTLASVPYPASIPLAILAAVSGGIQVAAIKKQKFAGTAQLPPPPSMGAPPTAPDASIGAVIDPVSNTSTILGDQQVTVTETDITSTQNNVSVIEESATF